MRPWHGNLGMRSDTDRLSVLYVINALGTGGAQRSLADLIGPLEARGIDMTVACLRRVDAGVQDEVTATHNVVFLGSRMTRALSRSRRLVKESRPDVIHTTIFESDVVGRLASIGTGIPVVTSIVNTSYSPAARTQDGISKLKLGIVRAIDGFTARHLTKGFHVLTTAMVQPTLDALGIRRERIHVIPRGRDVGRLGRRTTERRRRVRQQLQVDSDQAVLLSVGRREYQKGQLNAVEAMQDLRSKGADAVLLIAGREGHASRELEARVDELQLGECVRFLGHRTDVPDLMVAADVLVFPSLWEGFGGTVVEAMALGLPVVTSDIPVLREVTGEAAICVPPGSSTAIAEAVAQVLDDPTQADRMQVAGMNRFNAMFTIEKTADLMAAMYRSITGTSEAGQ
jgi:glycosyltransferase involved in cell wall biosynthesis